MANDTDWAICTGEVSIPARGHHQRRCCHDILTHLSCWANQTQKDADSSYVHTSHMSRIQEGTFSMFLNVRLAYSVHTGLSPSNTYIHAHFSRLFIETVCLCACCRGWYEFMKYKVSDRSANPYSENVYSKTSHSGKYTTHKGLVRGVKKVRRIFFYYFQPPPNPADCERGLLVLLTR